MDERDVVIIKSLQPLFQEARMHGMWFHQRYCNLWFTPDELEQKQANGKFIWGPPNWELCDPKIRVIQLEADIAKIQSTIDEIKAKTEKK